jgi:hypothetical protein
VIENSVLLASRKPLTKRAGSSGSVTRFTDTRIRILLKTSRIRSTVLSVTYKLFIPLLLVWTGRRSTSPSGLLAGEDESFTSWRTRRSTSMSLSVDSLPRSLWWGRLSLFSVFHKKKIKKLVGTMWQCCFGFSRIRFLHFSLTFLVSDSLFSLLFIESQLTLYIVNSCGVTLAKLLIPGTADPIYFHFWVPFKKYYFSHVFVFIPTIWLI